MNIAAPWIRRPVATTLIAIGILLVGIVAYMRLPIAALPSVDRPTIALWAGLPGASADTIASALAQPLERQIGSIPGIVEMRSFSATGGTQLTVQFQLDKNIDAAAGAIQAAINAAGPNLPKDMPQPPGYWKANPSGWSVITLALTSEVLGPSDIGCPLCSGGTARAHRSSHRRPYHFGRNSEVFPTCFRTRDHERGTLPLHKTRA